MPVNKVVFGNTTILDLTQSTLDSSNKILSGVTAYDRSGNLLIGSHIDDQTYTVTQQLTGVVSSNNLNKVISGGSLYLVLNAEAYSFLSNVTVTMGGVDITDQVFKPNEVAYEIEENLTNISSTNNVNKVLENGSLFIQLSPASNKAISDIVVLMGGVDITQQVFKGDQI